MRLIAIGKASANTPESELFTRYANRLKPRLTLTELPPGTGAPGEIKRREADAILATLPATDYAIALDTSGTHPTSPELAQLLTKWASAGKPLAFIIGGAEGLDARIITRANATLSLGNLTWPHLLVRPMLAEQLYRAQAINTGHPYHRSGRP
jgi:23S rRNA (pseudouridine1915-N3)-methyltransferase